MATASNAKTWGAKKKALPKFDSLIGIKMNFTQILNMFEITIEQFKQICKEELINRGGFLDYSDVVKFIDRRGFNMLDDDDDDDDEDEGEIYDFIFVVILGMDYKKLHKKLTICSIGDSIYVGMKIKTKVGSIVSMSKLKKYESEIIDILRVLKITNIDFEKGIDIVDIIDANIAL